MLIVNWTMNCCNYCNCADLCRTRQDVALDDRVSSCCGRTYYRNKPTVDRRHWASTKLQPWPSPNHKTLTELILSKLCSYSLNTKLSTGIHLKLYTNVTFCFSFWGLRPPDHLARLLTTWTPSIVKSWVRLCCLHNWSIDPTQSDPTKLNNFDPTRLDTTNLDVCTSNVRVGLHTVSNFILETNGQRYVCLSVVSIRGVHVMGGRGAMLHRNLRGKEGGKILDQPINTRHLVAWLSGKSLKLLPPDVTF